MLGLSNRLWSLPLLCAALTAGCTGLSLGESAPGADTYLDDGRPPVDDEEYVGNGQNWCVFSGSIAVDDRTETVFTALSTANVECERWRSDEPTDKTLMAIEWGNPTPRTVMDLSGRDDARILFPQAQILVMSEQDDEDTLSFLDPTSYEVLDEVRPGVRYHGTRMSHSRRFVAVADNTSEQPDIHVIDAATHEITVIPNNGDWLEAMWQNRRDRLLAIIFYDMWSPAVGSARILAWSPDPATGAFGRAVDEEGLWESPDLDIPIDGVDGDFLFSFTWVGISPDDETAVFPVVEDPGNDDIIGGNHLLLVVDLATGTHRTVHDARGPVGFTPDGSTIVSYRYHEVPGAEEGTTDTQPELLLIDVDSLEETTVPLEMFDWGPQFFVTRRDNTVVIANPLGDTKIVVHDVDAGTTTQLETPNGSSLYEFVNRDAQSELWMIWNGLSRLDYAEAVYEDVTLPFVPQHLNLLPGRDLLVLDDPTRVRIAYLHPDLRTEIWSVQLPTP